MRLRLTAPEGQSMSEYWSLVSARGLDQEVVEASRHQKRLERPVAVVDVQPGVRRFVARRGIAAQDDVGRLGAAIQELGHGPRERHGSGLRLFLFVAPCRIAAGLV